jgi:hypothetical protein
MESGMNPESIFEIQKLESGIDQKKLYRYVDPYYWDPQEEPRLEKYEVTRETPKGYWIGGLYQQEKKWVPKSGKNIFAFESEKDAMYNYVKRKERQILILENKLERARNWYKAARDIFVAGRPGRIIG